MAVTKSLHIWFLGIACFGVISIGLISFQIHQAQHHAATSNSLHSVLQASKQSVRQKAQPIKKTSSSNTSEVPPYHVVFSTSCEPQQNWESYVFFYHAWKVGQPGTVTRIASGCSAEQGMERMEFHKTHIATMNSNFYLHLTPDFSRGADYIRYGKARYKYMNKPYGLLHWMDTTFRLNTTKYDKRVEDGIVILMDPDMVLLRPIVHDYSHQNVLFVEDKPATKVVKHGYPMAQQDGYLTNQWMYLNVSYITNGGNIRHVKETDGPKHYNAGPPYLATVRDMYQMARLWTDYAPRVYEIHPKLFAEMFGYIFAATQLYLPHTFIRSIVVSTTETRNREGWPYIRDYPDQDVCRPLPTTPEPFQVTTDITSTTALPIALHYCKRYLLEKWFFSKYRLKKHYVSCETPILQLPPMDLVLRNYTYSLQPPPHGYYQKNPHTPWEDVVANLTHPGQAKKEAFMICQLIRAVNEAAEYFKRTACVHHPNTNWNRNYTFFNDPDAGF